MLRVTENLVPRNELRNRLSGAAGTRAIRGTVILACFAIFQLSLGCGGGSSVGSPPPPPPPPSNPQPAIVSLNPSFANAGGAAFTMTITGTNFVSSSAVQWNGSLRASTFASSTELEAQITAADVASAGSALVSVTSPAPGGGNSGSAEFAITAISNPAPTLGALNPSVINAGSPGFILTLSGFYFLPSSTVNWNGSPLTTTYISENQLEAQIPGSNVTTSGFAGVTVTNPAPGGGVSSPLAFSVAYTPMVVSQASSGLVWDATNKLIYVSVPSLAASNGNTVTGIDPTTGRVQSTQFAGSEPDVLAISDDDQYLYVGVDGSSSVQRFALPGLVPDINYSLGAISFLGPTFAWDLQVAPGLPGTTAVSRGEFQSSPWEAAGGLSIYDDGTERPTTAGGGYDSLQWGSDSVVYANNNESSNLNLYVVTVNSTGSVLSKNYPNEFSNLYVKLHYDSDSKLIYTDDGYVINPANGKHVGVFQAGGLMVPDSGLNRAFFMGQTSFQAGTSNFTIAMFNLTTLAPIAEIVVSNVQGYPLNFIRWGANGLAFNDTAGYVYILSAPFVAANGMEIVTPREYLSSVQRSWVVPRTSRSAKNVSLRIGSSVVGNRRGPRADTSSANPGPAITSLTPNAVAAGVGSFTLTVAGTNFVSYSVVRWNGSQLPTEYVSSSELQAQIGSSDVATAGSGLITVMSPAPGGGVSNSLPLTIAPPTSNPMPVIISLYPNSVVAGSSGFTLNVNGFSYFNASSVVKWNGSPRSAVLYSPGQLQVQISAADIATAGYAQITVTNAGPGGGLSNAAEFQILYQPTVVNQVTNDLVWDPINQVMYVSVPSSAGSHANQVCVLNPATAVIGNCQSGSEPDVLAISDDSQFLYVGMDGTNSVQRFTLPGLTPDINYSLGSDPNEGPYYALDLQVAPGAPHTTAVSKGLYLDPASQGGITIYDDSTARPVSTIGCGTSDQCYASIQWGADATELYAANSETTAYDFYTLTVSSSGVVLRQDYPGLWWNPGRIHYDRGSGLVYSDDGFHAVNPSTGLPAGIFEVGGGWPMAPDSTLDTVFILAKYVWQENANYTIDLFDMNHYLPVTHIPFSTTGGIGQLGRFVRWGTNGLAVNDMSGNIYLISGSFVGANRKPGLRKHGTSAGAK